MPTAALSFLERILIDFWEHADRRLRQVRHVSVQHHHAQLGNLEHPGSSMPGHNNPAADD